MFRRAHKTTKARQNAPETGCEFALQFVFSPYFADTYGGMEIRTSYTSLDRTDCLRNILKSAKSAVSPEILVTSVIGIAHNFASSNKDN